MTTTAQPPKSIMDEAEKAAEELCNKPEFNSGHQRTDECTLSNRLWAFDSGVRWLWQHLLERGQAEFDEGVVCNKIMLAFPDESPILRQAVFDLVYEQHQQHSATIAALKQRIQELENER